MILHKLYGMQINEFLSEMQQSYDKKHGFDKMSEEEYLDHPYKNYFEHFFSKIKYAEPAIKYKSSQSVWLVFEKNEMPMGLIVLLRKENKFVIESLSIHEDYKGMGYSKVLTETLIDFTLSQKMELEAGSFTEEGSQRLKHQLLMHAKKHPELNFCYLDKDSQKLLTK